MRWFEALSKQVESVTSFNTAMDCTILESMYSAVQAQESAGPAANTLRKRSVPGGASGLQIREGPQGGLGGFDSHSLPPSSRNA
jgi:hypothetical protein